MGTLLQQVVQFDQQQLVLKTGPVAEQQLK
jgi:hypothetical protein